MFSLKCSCRKAAFAFECACILQIYFHHKICRFQNIRREIDFPHTGQNIDRSFYLLCQQAGKKAGQIPAVIAKLRKERDNQRNKMEFLVGVIAEAISLFNLKPYGDTKLYFHATKLAKLNIFV